MKPFKSQTHPKFPDYMTKEKKCNVCGKNLPIMSISRVLCEEHRKWSASRRHYFYDKMKVGKVVSG